MGSTTPSACAKSTLLLALYMFCPEIQGYWFRKRELILSHASIRALDAAKTLGCIVEGNRQIAEALPAATLRTFVNLLIDHGRKPRWLRLLRQLVVVDGTAVKSNQEVRVNWFIMTVVIHFYSHVVFDLYCLYAHDSFQLPVS